MPHRPQRRQVLSRDRDAILNTDVSKTIQGHVGPNTQQQFRTITAVPFSLDALKIAGYEFLLVDQFGNHYHKMRAVLFDGEMYDVDQFIKPSMMMRHGGGHADFEDREAKLRLRITEDLLNDLRANGGVAFARTNLDLIKARGLSQAPVAIETKDITHQANVLEDALTSAIETAKKAAGEEVAAETPAPGFQPVKAQKAAAEQPLGEVIDFPALTPTPPPPKTGT